MKAFYSFLLLCFLLSSCVSNNYFQMYATSEIVLFDSPNGYGEVLAVVPVGSVLYVNKGKVKNSYRKFKFRNSVGWTRSQYYSYYKPDTSIYLTNRSMNIVRRDSVSRTNISTTSSSSNGTVHVKGYYRKDGTYVKPHTRSSPRRR